MARVLVTGITGFIGGELAARLVTDGHQVRGLSRRPPDAVTGEVPIIRGDAATGEGLADALRDIEVAYYLIHSLERDNPEAYSTKDRRAVDNFVAEAERSGVGRIVYLGVNHPAPGTPLSKHLRSRFEVEEQLVGSAIPTVSVRANFIVSARNPQFRHLMATVELPVIALPPAHEARLSPLDSHDVIACLAAAASVAVHPGQAFEIGGAEILSFGALLARIADAMGLEREVVAGQLADGDLTPELMTSISGIDPAYIGPLLETAKLDLLPAGNEIAELGVAEPIPLDEALRHAIAEADERNRPRSMIRQ